MKEAGGEGSEVVGVVLWKLAKSDLLSAPSGTRTYRTNRLRVSLYLDIFLDRGNIKITKKLNISCCKAKPQRAQFSGVSFWLAVFVISV